MLFTDLYKNSVLPKYVASGAISQPDSDALVQKMMADDASTSSLGGALKYSLPMMGGAVGGAAGINSIAGAGAGGAAAAGAYPSISGDPAAGADVSGNAPGGGSSSIWSTLGNLFKDKSGNIDLAKILGIVGSGMGIAGQLGEQSKVNDLMGLGKEAFGIGKQAYEEKAPLRNAAYSNIGTMLGNQANGPTDIFNKYFQQPGMPGSGAAQSSMFGAATPGGGAGLPPSAPIAPETGSVSGMKSPTDFGANVAGLGAPGPNANMGMPNPSVFAAYPMGAKMGQAQPAMSPQKFGAAVGGGLT